MDAVEQYLKSLQQIYSTGAAVPETSYYGALETLLNEIGKKLKPKVRCVLTIADAGAGHPDFGLYTSNQFQRAKDQTPIPGVLPERGAIEVKGWKEDSFVTAKGAQVSKYWKKYGLVLVTNYRDFVVVGRDDYGKPVRLESFRIAESEQAFIDSIRQPRKTAKEQGDRLIEFLKRAMLHAAPLTDPEDLAWFLASYAREARARVERAADLDALLALRTGLEEALGLKFEGDKGEHFFQATLVQTLFYGIFSSWVLWSRDNGARPDARFNWHEAGWTLHVPMIAALFSEIARPKRLKPLGVDEVLNWAGMVLNRVDRASFFAKFEEGQAVQYFYEPFLKAYDPELRKELGVWYTPPEIVRYQVERVDRVLRDELDIPDGLADDRVVILDPCCGTGAYLVEALRRIHRTLDEKGGDALVAQRLKKAVVERVFGFEILPAPFVVSHLQIGLMLRQLGAPLDPDSDERAGVYLTNALTGWEPPEEPKDQLPLFPELIEERDAANKVKQEAPILVILGNPPYNAFAGTSPEEEGGLVEPYKEGLTTPVEAGGWGIKKFNLDDLYIRFFRIAERRIVKSGKGVVSYISNYSWTSEPSFVVLRERLLESFDRFWIENMHGNRKISEYAPDGRTSETIFAIPGFSAGIRQGIVVSLWVKRGARQQQKTATVLYRDDIDAAKAAERRRQLLNSLRLKDLDRKYERASPAKGNRYSFRPLDVTEEYMEWPKLLELPGEPPVCGYKENRAFAMIQDNRDSLISLMRKYYDRSTTWEELRGLRTGLTRDAAGFDARSVREKVLKAEGFNASQIHRYTLRPFEPKWAYYSSVPSFWNRARPALYKHHFSGNEYLVTRSVCVAQPEGTPFFFTRCLGDFHHLRGQAHHFPVQLRRQATRPPGYDRTRDMFETHDITASVTANLSTRAREYLARLGVHDPDHEAETAGLIWMHALAFGYSPAYLGQNADGIRQDWPRIPLPAKKEALLASAELGRRVAALLDTEEPVDGVTCGTIRPELKGIAVISKVGGGELDPAQGHLDLTAGWGHGGKGGACMPGKGKYVERKTNDQRQKRLFGPDTLDVYLNDTAYWANVPRAVWDYYIGGYQVVKKWLSYREKKVLGRGLKLEEAEYVTEMVRRIAAIILLQPDLDANYEAVKSDTWPWPEKA